MLDRAHRGRFQEPFQGSCLIRATRPPIRRSQCQRVMWLKSVFLLVVDTLGGAD